MRGSRQRNRPLDAYWPEGNPEAIRQSGLAEIPAQSAFSILVSIRFLSPEPSERRSVRVRGLVSTAGREPRTGGEMVRLRETNAQWGAQNRLSFSIYLARGEKRTAERLRVQWLATRRRVARPEETRRAEDRREGPVHRAHTRVSLVDAHGALTAQRIPGTRRKNHVCRFAVESEAKN